MNRKQARVGMAIVFVLVCASTTLGILLREWKPVVLGLLAIASLIAANVAAKRRS